MRDLIHLFKTRRFLPLFITQFFGAFNDNAFKNAFLIWFTYDVALSHEFNAEMIVTLAAGLFILPFFLFSATAGQVADKYEQSWLTRQIKLVEIILMIACAACFFLQSVYGLLTILFLMGTQSTFYGPIKYSLLPEHLKDDELISGNGLIEGGTFLSILLGTIFGGLIIRTHYGVELLSFFVILFAIIGWFSSRYIPLTPIGDSQLKVGWNIYSETQKVVSYAKKERSVWLSIIGISWFWLIGATFLTQLPTYTKEVIQGDEHIVTLFLTIFSLGIGLGSIWCNKLLKGEINGRLVPYGSIGMSVAILLFSLSSYYYIDHLNILYPTIKALKTSITFTDFLTSGISSWGIVLSLLLLSVFAGVYIVPLYAIMQHRSERRYLARIIAANNIINSLFMVLATILILILFALHLSIIDILLSIGILNIPVFFIIRKVVKNS